MSEFWYGSWKASSPLSSVIQRLWAITCFTQFRVVTTADIRGLVLVNIPLVPESILRGVEFSDQHSAYGKRDGIGSLKVFFERLLWVFFLMSWKQRKFDFGFILLYKALLEKKKIFTNYNKNKYCTYNK